MPDREKVIKGWECHMEADTLGCADCPYRQGWRTCNFADTLFNDVYAMLKEQEAVEPITQSSVYDPDTWFYVCGSCKKSVVDRGDKFCRWCGRSVKWE